MASPADRTAPPRLPRMAELVAAQLRARIVGGDLPNGAELPREADLLADFGVSRPSLREAVRILETEGLVRIRRGKIGGAVVKSPDAGTAAYHLGLSLQARSTTLADMAVARGAIEPACAGLIAAMPDDRRGAVVAALTELVDQNEAVIGERTAFTRLAIRFHGAIAEHCGNTTLATLSQVLESVWSSQGWDEHPVAEPLDAQRETLKAHRRVVRAIASANQATASRALTKHITESQVHPERADTVIEVLNQR